MDRTIVLDMLRKYSTIVVWRLYSPNTSTHRHIHRHVYSVLKKLDCKVFWCDDLVENNALVPDGSLVISAEQCCKHIQYNKSNWYAMAHTVAHIENCRNYLHMRAYGDSYIGPNEVNWNETTVFNKSWHILSQTFVTDLLPEEFLCPIYKGNAKVINWVGSIWQDKNGHGNLDNIAKLKASLQKRGLVFTNYQNVSDEENIYYVRESRIAPAIGGTAQIASMLPCRIWKNISYGQLGITNLHKASEVFGDSVVYADDIDQLMDMALSVEEKRYKEKTLYQQKLVADRYTYLNWLYFIMRALEELGVQ